MADQAHDDVEKKHSISFRDKMLVGIGNGVQSIAIGMLGLVLACIAAFPDTCEIPRLMVSYSAIIRLGPIVSLFLWIGGLGIKSIDGRFNGSFESPKDRWGFAATYGVLFISALFFGAAFDNLTRDFPMTREEVHAFCEGPNSSK